jgi:AcrR family transcriptional regulator
MGPMPRIEADTVAEHRARQRDAIFDAAEQILLDGGYEALTFGALGERTGLKRNSIYRYFTSSDELIGELCQREMPRWIDEIDAAMAKASSPEDKAAAYATAQLKMVAAGHHRLAQVLGSAPLSPEVRARIAALPDQAAERLEQALADAGHSEPRVTAQLVTGLVSASFRMMGEPRGRKRLIEATADAARRVVADR